MTKDSDLSCLDTIAFHDLSESVSEHGKANEEHFNRSVKIDEDENYEVCFQCIQNHQSLTSFRNVALNEY